MQPSRQGPRPRLQLRGPPRTSRGSGVCPGRPHPLCRCQACWRHRLGNGHLQKGYRLSQVIGSDFSTGTGRVLTTTKRKWEVGLWEPLIAGRIICGRCGQREQVWAGCLQAGASLIRTKTMIPPCFAAGGPGGAIPRCPRLGSASWS